MSNAEPSEVDESTRRYFDQFTPPFNPKRFRFALEFLSTLDRDSTVADVGCSNGPTIELVRKNTELHDFVGIDIAEKYLDQCRTNTGASTLQGSILDRSFVERYTSRFDVVILGAVLHHLVGTTRRRSLANAETALRHCAELVRPGGALVIFEPTYTPQWMLAAVFYVKRLVSAVYNRRIEIMSRDVNFGAPVVSYLSKKRLREYLERISGLQIAYFQTLDRGTVAGVIHRQGVGVICRRV